ncbi:hypothetical protein [Roseicella aerolata]|uniref:Uncharacterized protein n=1 Tax=Roseicella aerolata TaxID=2883479 RepID=A0A9X1IGX0_9PROT|nr:hypothetical protein [Roseicella aerolata]MCB4823473.1 hypothetical protein [Roseicella aerolata]
MAIGRREEARLLSQAEREAVEPTHYPAISDLPEEALRDAIRRLRELRNRAGDIARQQRREMRRKAEPRGAAPASDNAGTQRKQQVLAAALKRVNREIARREDLTQGDSALVESARRALAMKRAARHRHHPGPGRTAGEGMRATPSGRPSVSPDPREIGRVSQFVRNAQVRRDFA